VAPKEVGVTAVAPDVPDILSTEHHRDPEIAYRYLREHAPAVFHPGSNSWLISRPEDILRLVCGQQVDSKNYEAGIGAVYGRNLLEMDGREHQQQRLLLNPLLHGVNLEGYQPVIRKVVDELFMPAYEEAAAPVLRGERTFGEMDIAASYFQALPISVIIEMLDLPRDHQDDFIRWFKDMMAFVANLGGDPGPIERGHKAREELTDFVLPLIKERRANPGTDLVSQMCQARVNDAGLDDEEVRAFISLMIVAGGETTERALGNVMLNLLQHPDQLAAVRQDRSLITDAFVETLRFSPPVNVAGRTAAVDIEIHGVTIPAGAAVTCLIGAANRDPRKFSDPDKFDIFRSDNSTQNGFTGRADHLGFLNGRHFCVGAALAKLEVEFGINLILDKMKELRIADGFVPKPTGLWTRGVDSLRVAFIPA
jgi:cytochrome P450